MRFARGRRVLRRHFMRGHQLGRVWVGHVAADDERGLWLWIADGSAFRDVGAADGRTFRQVPFVEWPRTPARLPWAAVGAEGEARANAQGVTVRCLTRPDGGVPDSEDEPDLLAYLARAY